MWPRFLQKTICIVHVGASALEKWFAWPRLRQGICIAHTDGLTLARPFVLSWPLLFASRREQLLSVNEQAPHKLVMDLSLQKHVRCGVEQKLGLLVLEIQARRDFPVQT